MLDHAATSFIPMPDPKAYREGGPCRLWLVTKNSVKCCPTELEMASLNEAEGACDTGNREIGRSQEEADGVILASMGGASA